ncbi:MAG: hypothetical protein LBQ12_01685, partial [Deltaproteobacteria bacterium]|nr:hypothetical protein [Deltaproteobacteria bacterium]
PFASASSPSLGMRPESQRLEARLAKGLAGREAPETGLPLHSRIQSKMPSSIVFGFSVVSVARDAA